MRRAGLFVFRRHHPDIVAQAVGDTFGDGQAGRMFAPLAQAKTTVMLVSALMSVTLAPALRDLALRGRIREVCARHAQYV